jgi:hypothetical protein
VVHTGGWNGERERGSLVDLLTRNVHDEHEFLELELLKEIAEVLCGNGHIVEEVERGA